MNAIKHWFQAHFSNPQVFALALLLVLFFAIVTTMGEMLAPVLASVVIAYLLEGVVKRLVAIHIPRFISVLFVFVMFMVFVMFVLVGLLPLVSRQATQLVRDVPNMIAQVQDLMMELPDRYPDLFSPNQVSELIGSLRAEVTNLGGEIVSISVSSVVGLITIVVYLVLVPLLVFLFMKDKRRILVWAANYLPQDLHLARTVWNDLDLQIGNYVRGKFTEILVVWIATYVTFFVLGLDFAALLSLAVGVSVLIPYIGAAVVTFPVALVAYFQWGLGADFGILMTAYLIVQAIDGYVLVPTLFSEVVNLHPIAIMTAILVFGGLWGFWGVFFAIPLATLVQAVLTAWPTQDFGNEDPPATAA
jgi:putative permease